MSLAALIAAFGLTTGLLAPSSLWAQGGPADYDLEIRVDPAEAGEGATVTATIGAVVRETGLQGWSFGVRHDPARLSLETAEQSDEAAAARVEPSFEVTRIIEDEGGTRVGYIQGVVLSFIAPAEVPLSEFFPFANSTYTVLDCADDDPVRVQTEIRVTNDLAAPGSPPVDLNFTVEGIAVVPDKITNGDLTIICEEIEEKDGLVLDFGPDDPECRVVANGDPASTLDIQVLLSNGGERPRYDVQGWSYGVAIDFGMLTAVEVAPGADAAALKGGEGPAFVTYNLDDANEDGSVTGVTAGAVIELDEPGTAVLPVAEGNTVHIDTITVRAAIVVPEGETRTTDLSYVDQTLGGDRPLEIIFVVDNESIVPTFDATKTVTLVGGDAPEGATYLRGDANSDLRVDIADGVWIISALFRGGEMTSCLPAANANADTTKEGGTRVDISDALYIFNYRLQPMATPGALFPAPSSPFPECGLDTSVSSAECPPGSHICN